MCSAGSQACSLNGTSRSLPLEKLASGHFRAPKNLRPVTFLPIVLPLSPCLNSASFWKNIYSRQRPLYKNIQTVKCPFGMPIFFGLNTFKLEFSEFFHSRFCFSIKSSVTSNSVFPCCERRRGNWRRFTFWTKKNFGRNWKWYLYVCATSAHSSLYRMIENTVSSFSLINLHLLNYVSQNEESVSYTTQF